ncbi:hypothetical protein MS3_00009535 [Schistosoma haematobium]|uniref:Uncharacterized protein n=1 Tax=Schistosoma haematobium TaxID=6185 RepID=A0A922IHY6_SCHHA|nr:hypothetical protein MS3_00009535 [Schistosoma haematobium]KAH9579356.1 hypothetical protein MS3_00009535 [Schistosoma haematobium]CAH8632177.1 unnamed protein product [Schistosoma haematobium]
MMEGHHKVPLFWTCFTFTTFGFTCSFVSMVMPYWYARYPQSQNRFVRLGLWEVCFEGYMAKKTGNYMYFGCFYLFDTKILTLWPIIFRDWFIACQAFFTCSFATHILAECVILTQVLGLVSIFGSRAVLCIMVTLSVNCFSTLVSLITMGVGVDTEQKIEKAAKHPWLEDLDQNSLSWSYGIAAISLLPSCLTVIILGWFVYPKKSPCGLLINSAWNWPTLNDLQCRYHMHDMHVPKISSSSNPQSSCHNITTMSTDYPHSLRSRTLIQSSQITGDQLSNELNNKILCKPTLFHKSGAQIETLPMITAQDQNSILSDNCGKLSSYDPRSADTVSLSSYEQPPLNLLYNPQTINMNHQFNSIMYSKENNFVENDYCSSIDCKTKLIQSNLLSTFHKFSAPFLKESTSERKQPQCITNSDSHSHLKSIHSNKSSNLQQPSSSNPDTSIWTENSIIQTARPMKRTKQKMKTDQFMKKLIPSENLFKFSSSFPNTKIESQPNRFVQKAKPMNRK